MKKKLIVVVMTACLLAGCGKVPKLENGQEAIVEFSDGTKYSVDEIWDEFKDQYALQILLEKIDKKILLEEYKDKKDDAEEYVKSYEASIKANYVDEKGNFDETALNNALTQYGYSSLDVLLEQQQNGYYRELAATDYAKTQVTDSQIKDYYNKKTIGDIKAVHILVAPKSTSTEDDKAAKTKAKSIITAIKNDVKSGTSIEDAFKKYENDSEVTYQDLGEFNRGDMVEAFENAVVDMKVKTYSSTPVKTSYGYHVIYKIEQKKKPSLDDAKDGIKDTLAQEAISKDSTMEVTAMMELRKKYGVKWDDSELEDSYNKYMNYLINKKD